VLLVSSPQGLHHALDHLSAASGRAGMKITTKSPRYHVSPETQGQGSDPASKVGEGETISVIFGSQVSLQVHHCKGDDVYFTSLL